MLLFLLFCLLAKENKNSASAPSPIRAQQTYLQMDYYLYIKGHQMLSSLSFLSPGICLEKSKKYRCLVFMLREALEAETIFKSKDMHQCVELLVLGGK